MREDTQDRLDRLPRQVRTVLALVAEVFPDTDWLDEPTGRWVRLHPQRRTPAVECFQR
mgnify:CR=1 FL=1